jgi:hypothetical protein
MRAQEGKGGRFEVARKFCELQHSLVASRRASVEVKLAALHDIEAAVNTLHARFPAVFAGAKDLVVSARDALSVSEEIEHLKRDLEAADLENATWLLNGRSAALAWEINDTPFEDHLWGELCNCWLAVKATHSDQHVRELLGKHLNDYPPTRSEGAASSSSSSSPSASDIASLRAAESTKVTLPPLRMHAEPAGPSRFVGVHGLGRTVELVENVAKLSMEIDKFLEELLRPHSSHSSGRLLTAEVAMLIDQIALHGNSGEAALFAKLGRGLNELRLTHRDPEMRAEMSRALGLPGFDQLKEAIYQRLADESV